MPDAGQIGTLLHFIAPSGRWVDEWRYAKAHTAWQDQEIELGRTDLRRDTRGEVHRVTRLDPKAPFDWTNPRSVV